MAKLCLFFTAAAVASAGELADIERIKHRGYNVVTQNGLAPDASFKYGATLKTADAVACTAPGALPTVIATAVGASYYPDGDISMGILAKPEAFGLFAPRSASFVHTATMQLAAIKANLAEDETEAVSLVDVTLGSASTTYVSGTPGTCTVSVDGLLTGVAIGTSVITATHTYSSGKTVTASVTVTCT